MDLINDNSSQSNSSNSLNDLKSNKSEDKTILNEIENCDCNENEIEFNRNFEREKSEETVLPVDNQNLILQDVAGAVSSVDNSQSGLQKLLNKQKMELAFELRRLQFANRPVSNTESKNRLEQFFTENNVGNTNNNNINNNNNSNMPRRDPTRFRSEATRNEIEELESQQRVSNVLQLARQRLESALQRMTTSTATITSTPRAAITISQPVLNQSAVYTNGLQTSQNSITSNVSSNIIIQSSDGSTNVYTPVTAWVPVSNTQNQQTQETNQQAPIIINTATPSTQFLTSQPADPLRSTIDQIRREQIIEEISELVHQQLVSSTLESEFRTRLEERVMQHLQNSGTNGDRTRNYIRNIQQTTHIERNDFSELGIFTNNAINAENLDSASTYQASQHQQHRQATAINTREIKSLKSEISELKSMMKLSFELQLDMQRSLRQEISALISGSIKELSKNGSNTNKPLQSTINSTKPSNEGNCVICTDGAVDTVLYKCGHMCTCYACSMTLKQGGKHCPVCRAPIVDILRAYRCN